MFTLKAGDKVRIFNSWGYSFLFGSTVKVSGSAYAHLD